jgi:hypothetical protein
MPESRGELRVYSYFTNSENSIELANIYASLYTKSAKGVHYRDGKVRTRYRILDVYKSAANNTSFKTTISDIAPNPADYTFWIDTSVTPSVRKVSNGTLWRDYKIETNINNVKADGANVVSSSSELNASISGASTGDIKYLYNEDDNTIDEYVFYNGNWVKKTKASVSNNNNSNENNNSNNNSSSLSIFDIFEDNSSIFAYNLDTSSDDLGGTYDGTDYNAISYLESGKFENSAEFNGNDGFIDTGYDLHANLTDGHSFSLSLWFYSYDIDTEQILFGDRHDSDEKLYIAIKDNTKIKWKIGSKKKNVKDLTLLDNTWYHLVWTFDSTSEDVKVYLNNSLLSTVNHDKDKLYPKHNALIGYFDKSMDGRIDQLRFFNREITSAEVDTLFNEGN